MWVSWKGAWPGQRADNESESTEHELAGRDRLVAPPRVEDERGATSAGCSTPLKTLVRCGDSGAAVEQRTDLMLLRNPDRSSDWLHKPVRGSGSAPLLQDWYSGGFAPGATFIIGNSNHAPPPPVGLGVEGEAPDNHTDKQAKWSPEGS